MTRKYRANRRFAPPLIEILAMRQFGGSMPDIATSRPVAVLLRPGKTPSGQEVRCHVRRLVRRIRSHWPATRLTIRGDGHYGGP